MDNKVNNDYLEINWDDMNWDVAKTYSINDTSTKSTKMSLNDKIDLLKNKINNLNNLVQEREEKFAKLEALESNMNEFGIGFNR